MADITSSEWSIKFNDYTSLRNTTSHFNFNDPKKIKVNKKEKKVYTE